MPTRCRDDWTMQQRPEAERLRNDLAVRRTIPHRDAQPDYLLGEAPDVPRPCERLWW